jgi:acetylornithine deacetylase/succinyl-diaminopimelate desuccinylase-like protein
VSRDANDPDSPVPQSLTRRNFIETAAAGAAALGLSPQIASALQDQDKNTVLAQIPRQHEATLQILREWIALPSIAAENIGYPQGAEYQAKLARDAGFSHVEVISTSGKPGVFATYDVGAPNWLGIYFMYDVKQYDPAEWSSPPLEGRLVEKPGLGKVIMGRGATNTKGPQTAVLAALHAFKAAGKQPPVNIALVCEGEEEIGSPNFKDIVFKPQVEAALRKCLGIIIPLGSQSPDGGVEVNLGAKGIIEAELVSTGEKWGRGPARDIHSSLAAMVDSPAWHLVLALATLKKEDGNTIAVEGFYDRIRPLSARQKQILEAAIAKKNEATLKRTLGVQRWIGDESFHDAQVRLVSQPTINIEGLVGGYTGPGGKTILPYKAVAKIDVRLVPDMTVKETLGLLRTHLARHGFGDIEVNMSGGYDPTETDPDSKLIQGMLATYRRLGVEPLLWPRLAGSWPGVTFTGEPLKLAAGQFGLGHGGGAHAPDEYYVIEASNPKLAGWDGVVKSYVEFLYSLA